MKIIDLNRVQNYFKKSQGVIFYFSFSMKTINCNNLIKKSKFEITHGLFYLYLDFFESCTVSNQFLGSNTYGDVS